MALDQSQNEVEQRAMLARTLVIAVDNLRHRTLVEGADDVDIADNLGNALWAIACIAHKFGFDLSDIAELNVAKIQAK